MIYGLFGSAISTAIEGHFRANRGRVIFLVGLSAVFRDDFSARGRYVVKQAPLFNVFFSDGDSRVLVLIRVVSRVSSRSWASCSFLLLIVIIFMSAHFNLV